MRQRQVDRDAAAERRTHDDSALDAFPVEEHDELVDVRVLTLGKRPLAVAEQIRRQHAAPALEPRANGIPHTAVGDSRVQQQQWCPPVTFLVRHAGRDIADD
jgi:hypothetical protein